MAGKFHATGGCAERVPLDVGVGAAQHADEEVHGGCVRDEVLAEGRPGVGVGVGAQDGELLDVVEGAGPGAVGRGGEFEAVVVVAVVRGLAGWAPGADREQAREVNVDEFAVDAVDREA